MSRARPSGTLRAMPRQASVWRTGRRARTPRWQSWQVSLGNQFGEVLGAGVADPLVRLADQRFHPLSNPFGLNRLTDPDGLLTDGRRMVHIAFQHVVGGHRGEIEGDVAGH